MTDICYLCANDVLTRFRAKTLSPVEYIDALIARSETVNPVINAITEAYFDEAREAAKAAETAYATGTARALEGLPVAIKDVHHWHGKHTTQGSYALGHQPDTATDPIVERLARAGAIFHMRTTVPEFCLAGVCWSNRYGITRNPWNLEYAPGGSSGGSGAALAAGMTPLATGTDIGGSIRIPASACGLVGYKPPHGRNPDGAPFNFDRYNHCGVLSRCVADTALAQNIISGPHPNDHDSLRDRVVIPDAFDPRPLRVGWSMDLGYMPIDADIRANTRAAVEVFHAAGCTVDEVALNWTDAQQEDAIWWYSAMHFGRQALWLRDQYGDRMTPYALNAAKAAEEITPDQAARSWDAQHAMYQTLGPLLDSYDVIVCPTLAIGCPPADHDPTQPGFTVDGTVVDGEFGWDLTHQFNMMHNCPVMSVPSGRDRHGVPTGVQIIGRTFDDLTVFRAAQMYQNAAPTQFVPAAGLPDLGL
ncbi:MAG: amidase [Roseovarius sp.]